MLYGIEPEAVRGLYVWRVSPYRTVFCAPAIQLAGTPSHNIALAHIARTDGEAGPSMRLQQPRGVSLPMSVVICMRVYEQPMTRKCH